MIKDGKRSLSTIRIVKEIRPIPDADQIELAIVDGWQCVVKKNQLRQGDKAVYFEIDSLIPCDRPEFSFLKPNKDGKHRLRTMTLRKQLSQGLLIPLPEEDISDLDSYFGIVKYELPETCGINGDILGPFPGFIPKTDLERIQNIEDLSGTYEITAKYDGTSMTVYSNEGHIGVCGKNFEKKETESCAYWKAANRINLPAILSDYGRNIALQGELMGPKIQGNGMNLAHPDFFIFDIFIDGRYLSPYERWERIDLLRLGMNHIPILSTLSTIKSLEDALAYADEVASQYPGCEGIVAKGEKRFKIISNNYLLKTGR